MIASPSSFLRQRLLPFLLPVLLLACGGGGPTRQPPAPKTVDGWVRLDRSVVPRRYELDLTVDPRTTGFSGKASIDVELSRPTREIALHAEQLSLRSIEIVAAGVTHPARATVGLHGGLLLAVDGELPAGPARIDLRWDAAFSDVSHGLYRVQEGARWYAFTQFQPLSARRVFPGFDQPEFKTPFRVKLRVPRNMMAASSGPMVSRVTQGEQRTFIFDETKPIPTYLLAMAVGEFDAVPVPEGERGGPVMRVLTPAGQERLADYAARRTQPILAYLVDWFGRSLPFAKLDQLAVPEFTFGAMENVGLVTYRSDRLLFDPQRSTERDRLWTDITMAHELAHMWFGNYVTPAWWDDLWLSESFATWMQTKVVDALTPELEAGLEAAAHLQYVMYLDSKRDARAVRQPVRKGGDVYNAFDGITYGKGAAVLRMTEAWLGEPAFQAAVRSYLEDHAYGSGGTAELLSALDAESGAPVSRVVSSFVDRPGTPLLSTELDCAPGEPAPAVLMLEQRRYLPAGRTDRTTPWSFPVCVHWAEAEGAARERACFLMEEAQQEFTLPAERCPVWLHPNAEEIGYYRWSLPESALLSLLEEHLMQLTLRERLALPGGLRALLEAGVVTTEIYLDGLQALSQDRHRRMAEAIVPGLWSLSHALDDGDRPAFARFVRRVLGPYLEGIGLVPAVTEPRDSALLRSRLVPALADLGRDEAILARAERAADAFVAGEPQGFTVEELRVLVPMASWQGDAGHWEALRGALASAEAPARRRQLIVALGSFGDPTLLLRSLDLFLDGTLRPSEWGTIAGNLRRTSRDAAWGWVRQHYDALVERLGPAQAAALPHLTSGLCSQRDHDAVAAFFQRRPQPGSQRNLALALEDIERCMLAREALLPPMRRWLAEPAR